MVSATPISDEFEEVAREVGISDSHPTFKMAKELFLSAIGAPAKILSKCETPDEVAQTLSAMSRELEAFRTEIARKSASRN